MIRLLKFCHLSRSTTKKSRCYASIYKRAKHSQHPTTKYQRLALCRCECVCMCVPDPPNHRATFPQVQGLSAAGRATRLVCVALRHSARRTILKTSLQHAARRNAARLLVLAYHTPPPPQPQFPFRPCVCVCLSNDSGIVCFWLGCLFYFCWYISLGHCGVLVGRLIRMARGCYVSPI